MSEREERRRPVGRDHYENTVFEGQVAIKDPHGNTVYRDPEVGTGPDHLKAKHEGRDGARHTGAKDAHGNEIWTSDED